MDWIVFLVLLLATFAIIVCLGAAFACAGHLAEHFWPKPKAKPVLPPAIYGGGASYYFVPRDEEKPTSDLTPYVEKVCDDLGIDLSAIPPQTYAEFAEKHGWSHVQFAGPRYVEQDGTITHWPTWGA